MVLWSFQIRQSRSHQIYPKKNHLIVCVVSKSRNLNGLDTLFTKVEKFFFLKWRLLNFQTVQLKLYFRKCSNSNTSKWNWFLRHHCIRFCYTSCSIWYRSGFGRNKKYSKKQRKRLERTLVYCRNKTNGFGYF